MKFLLAIVLFVVATGSAAAQTFVRIPDDESGITFANTIVESDTFNVLLDFYAFNGGGVAAGDIDQDGLADLVFTGTQVGCAVYKNEGGFKFSDVTEDIGVDRDAGRIQTGVLMCDLTGDGAPEIIICRRYDRPFFYINDGEGEFSEEGLDRGLTITGQLTQAMPIDYDLDGDLDLFFVVNGEPRRQGYVNKGEADLLFENTGGGNYVNVTSKVGLFDEGYGLSASIMDANNDGRPDIFVANDFEERDNLWINNSDGTFTNIADTAFQSMSWASMGSDVADLNNDGWLDIISLDMYPRDHERRMTQMGNMSIYGPFFDSAQRVQNAVHVNMGNGHFMNTNHSSGLAATDWSWAVLINDFDFDGHNDVYVTNGIKRDIGDQDYSYSLDNSSDTAVAKLYHLMPRTRLQNYYFKGTSDLQFSEATKSEGLADTVISNGATYVDLDNDGDLDVVVNNTDSVAFVYRNTTVEKNAQNHFATIEFLTNDENSTAVGCRYTVFAGDKKIVRERQVARGYQSSTFMPKEVVGIGSETGVDSIVVTWRGGSRSTHLPQNTRGSVMVIEAGDLGQVSSAPTIAGTTWLSPLPKETISYRHRENRYDDFKRQRLIPFRYSRLGPAMVVEDFTGDGLEDIVFTGPKYGFTQLFVQDAHGEFTHSPMSGLEDTDESEDVDAAAIDIDNDGDLDLYIVTGGTEFSPGDPELVDRLYLNDGTGVFTQAPDLVPEIASNGSCVAVGDFNGDGAPELFVGGHSVPGEYPTSETSAILSVANGKLEDATLSYGLVLRQLERVRDAEAIDLNGDGIDDLVVACEWDTPKLLLSGGGTFNEYSVLKGFDRLQGMWTYVDIVDVNDDGKQDIIAGNVGTNCRYVPSPEAPITMWSGDFDENGSIDPIITFTDTESSNRARPTRGRMTLTQHIPSATRTFNTYMEFAESDITKVLTKEQRDTATKLVVNEFRSGVFINDGNTYRFQPFPLLAQTAPVYGSLVMNLDGEDGQEILLSGNNREADPSQIGVDGSIGLVLQQTPDGAFVPVLASTSGYSVGETARGSAVVNLADGGQMIVTAVNGGYPRCFRVVRR